MKNSSRSTWPPLRLALPLLLALGSVGLAQEDSADETVTLDRLEVSESNNALYQSRATLSGTKLDTPLHDLPQAIQVVPFQVIRDQQALVLEDAVRNVSGVYRENTFGNTLDRFSIRGFSQNQFLRDGFRDPQNQVRSLAGVERVEVLKGPASILYGQLEPGGIINVVTRRPQRMSAYVADVQVGTDQLFRVNLDATGAAAPDSPVLVRLTASAERSDSFRGVAATKIERIDLAPSFTWEISEKTDAWVQFNYLRSERPFDRGLVALGTGVAAVPNDRFLGEPGDHLFVEQHGVVTEINHRFNANWRLRQGLRGSWSDSNDFRAEPSSNPSATGVLNRRWSMNDDEGHTLATQTDLLGSLQTGAISHRVLAGFDLTQTEAGGINGSNPTNIPLNIFAPIYGVTPLPITALARDDRNTTDGVGLYVQDQINLRDDLKLLASVRYDAVDYTGRDFLDGTTRRQSDDAWTPRAGVVYQPIKSVSLFASYSKGFNPVTSGSLANGDAPRPTTGEQIEGGVKTEFFGGKLTSTVAAFEITKQNLTLSDPANTGFVIQTGEVRSRGFEFDISGRLAAGWDVIASYAFIDAEITRDTALRVGNRLLSVPEHGASLWSVYRLQHGALRGFGFGGGAFYVGERAGDSANSFWIPSYVRVDATLFYERPSWRAAINIRNAFDRDYYAAASSRTRIDPGAPLAVIGSVSVRF
jgi:iron complex outermembrane receptor protein